MGYGAAASRNVGGRSTRTEAALLNTRRQIDGLQRNAIARRRKNPSACERIENIMPAGQLRLDSLNRQNVQPHGRSLRRIRRTAGLGGIGDREAHGAGDLWNGRRHGHAKENKERAYQPLIRPRALYAHVVSGNGGTIVHANSVGQKGHSYALRGPTDDLLPLGPILTA